MSDFWLVVIITMYVLIKLCVLRNRGMNSKLDITVNKKNQITTDSRSEQLVTEINIKHFGLILLI